MWQEMPSLHMHEKEAKVQAWMKEFVCTPRTYSINKLHIQWEKKRNEHSQMVR